MFKALQHPIKVLSCWKGKEGLEREGTEQGVIGAFFSFSFCTEHWYLHGCSYIFPRRPESPGRATGSEGERGPGPEKPSPPEPPGHEQAGWQGYWRDMGRERQTGLWWVALEGGP